MNESTQAKANIKCFHFNKPVLSKSGIELELESSLNRREVSSSLLVVRDTVSDRTVIGGLTGDGGFSGIGVI